MTKVLSPKDPTEVIVVTFDFANEFPDGTLTSPTVEAVVDGGDGTPIPGLLSGAAQVDGLRVMQAITGGDDFTDYRLRCTATVDGVLSSVRAAILPVRAL